MLLLLMLIQFKSSFRPTNCKLSRPDEFFSLVYFSLCLSVHEPLAFSCTTIDQSVQAPAAPSFCRGTLLLSLSLSLFSLCLASFLSPPTPLSFLHSLGPFQLSTLPLFFTISPIPSPPRPAPPRPSQRPPPPPDLPFPSLPYLYYQTSFSYFILSLQFYSSLSAHTTLTRCVCCAREREGEEGDELAGNHNQFPTIH